MSGTGQDSLESRTIRLETVIPQLVQTIQRLESNIDKFTETTRQVAKIAGVLEQLSGSLTDSNDRLEQEFVLHKKDAENQLISLRQVSNTHDTKFKEQDARFTGFKQAFGIITFLITIIFGLVQYIVTKELGRVEEMADQQKKHELLIAEMRGQIMTQQQMNAAVMQALRTGQSGRTTTGE